MTRVLLIQPNYNIDSPNQSPWIPIALVELATYIKQYKHEAKILDRNLYSDDEKLKKIILDFKPDIVGMTCYTSLVIKDVLHISKIVKEISNAMVIIGGIHATLEPKSLLDIKHIDYIVRGEGELPLLDICNLIQDGNLKEIKNIQNVNYNQTRPLIDLNTLPIADYDLLEISKYPMITFYTSRGCMGQCKFCYNKGRRLRFYNTENIIKLMTSVIEKYNIKEFTIADDNFATQGERTKRICDALSKYNIIFHCFLRADQAYDEVLQNLKNAGCWGIQFGLESGNQRILDFINKRTTVEQNIKAIQQCKKYGIYAEGSFIIGLPTETEEEMNDTINFIKKYKPDCSNMNCFKPFPHTELFDLCVQEGKITIPQTLEEWIPYCNINAGEPNFSEIPTDKLLEVLKYTQRSNFLNIKKFFRLIFTGHIDYAIFKLKHKIKGILKIK